MLTLSDASNISGKSVTTLIVSIGFFHGHELVPPLLHDRARRHADEREQPLAVVRAPASHDERPRNHLAILVHHQQPGLRREHGARILDQRDHRDLPLLAVRLAHAPDYAGRWPSTPPFFKSVGTLPVGGAPWSGRMPACSLSPLLSAGLARGR